MIAGCQDLAVTDPNAPDRARATKAPVSAETFVSSSFRTWWPVAGHGNYPSWAFSTVAHDVTSGFADFGQLEISTEPRAAWNNSPVNTQNSVNQRPWYDLYSTISTVNDALIAIDSGLVIGDAARTTRTRAVGKFMQGMSHGYLGLYFDSAFVANEKLALDTITTPQFQPYPEVIKAAISQLDTAIAISKTANFTLPGDSWLFAAMDQNGFASLANSFAARLLAYSPRTSADRAAVDWNEVIRRIDAGITTDFAPTAQPNMLWDDWQRLAARVRSGPPSDYGRPSYWLLGPADSSGGYQNWINTPLTSRQPFQMRTQGSSHTGGSRSDSHRQVHRLQCVVDWSREPRLVSVFVLLLHPKWYRHELAERSDSGHDAHRDGLAEGRGVDPARSRQRGCTAHQQDTRRKRTTSPGDRRWAARRTRLCAAKAERSVRQSLGRSSL